MKSNKLQNAIGMVDGELVARADQKKARRLPRLIGVVAAVLVVAIGVGILFGGQSPWLLNTYAVSEVTYPSRSPYPEGEWLPGFESRYDAWNTDRRAQRTYFGAGEDLGAFFGATAAAFLAGANGENRVYSPLNVYFALAMLAETTGGESREQILSLLGASDIESLRSQAHSLWLANYRDDGAVLSRPDASLWLDRALDYNKETLEALSENYFASSYWGEMGSKGFDEAYRAWLNEATDGLLGEMVKDRELGAETILAIATTLSYRAKWDTQFSKDKTKTGVFHAATGDVDCSFMRRTETYGMYYWGAKFGAVSTALKASGGRMWFILPDEGVAPEELLGDAEALSFLSANGRWESSKSLKVHLSLPKFDVQSQTDLKEGLVALGVTDCFEQDSADFSPLVGASGEVVLSSVNHGARVTIDEEGVTAAAFTEMHLAGSAEPPEDEIDFVLDRPFLFVLTGEDGTPLFIGVVNQP